MIAPELEGFYAEHAAGRPHWKYFWFDYPGPQASTAASSPVR